MSNTIKSIFPVTGMSCAGCAMSVETMLKSVEGVTDAGVNFANQTAWAQYDPQAATPQKLQEVIRSIGYDLIIESDDPNKEASEARERTEKQYKLTHNILSAAIGSCSCTWNGLYALASLTLDIYGFSSACCILVWPRILC